MIGLGAKYLTAAGFGRYRITAASLGNLDLLGSIGWLNGAAKAAILAAFGDDGKAVINATNVYLGGIAASDRDKATALAGFINEDPMMVCSLGLEPQGVTMPIRYIVLNGSAYAVAASKANQDTIMSFKGTISVNKSGGGEKWHTLFAADNGVTSRSFGIWANDTAGNGTLIEWGGTYAFYANVALNRRFYALMNKNVTTAKYLDTNTEFINKTHSAATFTTDGRVGLFMLIRGTSIISGYDGYLQGTCEEIVKIDGSAKEWYVPFMNGETAELIDLEASMVQGTKVFAERHGSFTIPDISYTPSTP